MRANAMPTLGGEKGYNPPAIGVGASMVPGSDFWIGATGVGLVAVFYILIFFALVRVLHRLGFSGWWSLMIFLWPIGLLMLAFVRWPSVDGCKCPAPGSAP